MRHSERIFFCCRRNDKGALSLPVFDQPERNQLVYGLSYGGAADAQGLGEFAFDHQLLARLDSTLEYQIA